MLVNLLAPSPVQVNFSVFSEVPAYGATARIGVFLMDFAHRYNELEVAVIPLPQSHMAALDVKAGVVRASSTAAAIKVVFMGKFILSGKFEYAQSNDLINGLLVRKATPPQLSKTIYYGADAPTGFPGALEALQGCLRSVQS